MYLFIALILLTFIMAFIGGYKTGFIKFIIAIILTAVAAGSSCFLYLHFYSTLNYWFNFSLIINAAVVLVLFFLLQLGILTAAARLLPLYYNKTNKKIVSKVLGGVTAIILNGAAIAIIICLTDVVKIPATLNRQLENTGVPALVHSTAYTVFEKIFPGNKNNNGIILGADNTQASLNESSTSFPYLTNNFSVEPGLENDMLAMINSERIKAGLSALVADGLLTQTARKHSADMFTRGYFSHNTPEGLTPFNRLHAAKINYLYAGENLAFASTLLKAHEGLMHSPDHRANILNRKYHKVGIGILENQEYGLLITQEFKD
jgi:uncharacterized protein YkwD